MNHSHRDKMIAIREQTKIIKTVTRDDLDQTVSALVVMIHSHHLDVARLARGEIPANGGSSLLSDRGLGPGDLADIATKATDFGYIGTAAGKLNEGHNFFFILLST